MELSRSDDRLTRSNRGLARFTIRRGLAWIRVGSRSRDFPVRAELRARKARVGERGEGVVTFREIRSFSW